MGSSMGWREQFESIFGGRRTVELWVRLSPQEALQALREHFVSDGSYGATAETAGVLEVEDRSGAGGCLGLVVIALLVAFFTLGVGLVLLVLWAFTKFRRLRIEAISSEAGVTILTVSGYPQQAVTEAEEWIRTNLLVVEQS